MDFDIQTFLAEMRKEQREDHQTLTVKVEGGFEAQAARASKIASDLVTHEAADATAQASIDHRLTNIEGIYQGLKWFTRTAIAALLAFIFDLLKNHLLPLAASAVAGGTHIR